MPPAPEQNVDYAQLNFATAAAAKFVQDCQAQGYNPTWGSSEQAAGPAFAALQLHDVRTRLRLPVGRERTPVKTFRDAMKKYARGSNWREGTASFTWGGLEMLRSALATVAGDPDPQTSPWPR